MDYNFGEINEPVSRAFYDDYDEPSLNLHFSRPSWKFTGEDGKEGFAEKTKNFVIIEGSNALNIVNPSILKKSSPIATLRPQHCVDVFVVGEFTICVAEEKDLNYFSTITELLEPWIKSAENCTIVSLQSTTEYRASQQLSESCFIRSIASKLSDIAPLEVPNFITGTGAGVATFRKLHDLQFSCFVVYIDIYDVIAIRTVLDLLKRIGAPHDESIPLKPLNHKSNLYM